jgi:hypothetical protein
MIRGLQNASAPDAGIQAPTPRRFPLDNAADVGYSYIKDGIVGGPTMRAILIVFILLAIGVSAAAVDYDTCVWSSANIGGKECPKAAMLVPIEISGVPGKFYAQLDTGADATIFYGNILRKFGIDVDSAGGDMPSFRWYENQEQPEKPVFLNWTMDSDIDPQSKDPLDRNVGTIGLDKVMDKILILDFLHERYAVLDDTADLADISDEPIDYVPAEIAYNKFYVRVEMGDDTIPAVRYDCGSSSAALILPLDWWQWATGLNGDEPKVVKDSIQSWGKYIEMWAAPSQYDMIIGAFRMKTPVVTFVDWPDPTLETTKLLGNAPFADSCLVVVDCIRSKFGVRREK